MRGGSDLFINIRIHDIFRSRMGRSKHNVFARVERRVFRRSLRSVQAISLVTRHNRECGFKMVPKRIENNTYLLTGYRLRIHAITSHVQNSISKPNKFRQVAAFFLEHSIRIWPETKSRRSRPWLNLKIAELISRRINIIYTIGTTATALLANFLFSRIAYVPSLRLLEKGTWTNITTEIYHRAQC